MSHFYAKKILHPSQIRQAIVIQTLSPHIPGPEQKTNNKSNDNDNDTESGFSINTQDMMEIFSQTTLSPPHNPSAEQSTFLVFGKETSVEVATFENGEVRSILEEPVFGTIIALQKVHLADQDLICILSDSGLISLFAFQPKSRSGSLIQIAQKRVASSRREYRDLAASLIIDPLSRFVVSASAVDALAVIPLRAPPQNSFGSAIIWSFPKQHVSTQTVFWKIEILLSEDKNPNKGSIVCLVHNKDLGGQLIHILEFSPTSKELWLRQTLTPKAYPELKRITNLIPTFSFDRIFSVTPNEIYENLLSSSLEPIRTAIPMGQTHIGTLISCYCWIAIREENFLLFATEYGQLAIFDSKKVSIVANISQCAALVWLPPKHVLIVGSMCDSKVIEIESLGIKKTKRILDDLPAVCTVPNWAPIWDYQMVDVFGEQQHQLLACSGNGNQGRLQIVRNGIEFHKLFSTGPDFPKVTGLWTLKRSAKEAHHEFMVFSFVEATRVMTLHDSAFEDITDSSLFQSHVGTIYAGAYAGSLFQATSDQVCLISISQTTFQKSASWRPHLSLKASSSAIYLVFQADHNILVASGNTLTLLEITFDHQLIEKGNAPLETHLSCAYMTHYHPELAGLIIVGSYNSTLTLISSDRLQILHSIQMNRFIHIDQAIPNSVIAAQMTSEDLVLAVGLRNGHLLVFNLPQETPKHPEDLFAHVSHQQLGTLPVSLFPITSSSSVPLIALSDRPWAIRPGSRRPEFRPISLPNTSWGSALNLVDIPDAMALISEDTLHVGYLHTTNKLHVTSLKLPRTPRKIEYLPHSRLAAVICSSWMEPTAQTFSVDLIHPISGTLLNSVLLERTQAHSISMWSPRGQKYLCIGSFSKERGAHIIIYKDDSSQQQQNSSLTEIARIDLKSEFPVLSLVPCGQHQENLIAASGNYLIWLKALEVGSMKIGDRWDCQIPVTHVSAHTSRIVATTQRQGLLFFGLDEANQKFEPLVAKLKSRVGSSSFMVNDEMAIGLDKFGNIYSNVYDRGIEFENMSEESNESLLDIAYSVQESTTFLRTGTFSYLELQRQNHSFTVATLSGAVYAFVPLSDQEFKLLETLQTKMENSQRFQNTVLGHNHRALRSAVERTKGVIDAEYVAQFLELPPEAQATLISDPQRVVDAIVKTNLRCL